MLSLIFGATPSFQSCIEDHKGRSQYSELYEKQKTPDIIRVRIYLNGGCVAHVFYVEHDAIEALAALGGAFFSLILTVSTVFLWAETKRLALGAETQSEDMRDAIREAVRAADAAEDQVKISSMAIHAHERAWLDVKMESFGDFSISRNGTASLDINLRIKNIGKTPALNVHTEVLFLASDKNLISLRDELTNAQRVVDLKYSRMVLPQDAYDRPWRPFLRPHEVVAGTIGGGYIYPHLIACVTYQTIPDMSVHQTTVCFALSAKQEGNLLDGLLSVDQRLTQKENLSISDSYGSIAD